MKRALYATFACIVLRSFLHSLCKKSSREKEKNQEFQAVQKECPIFKCSNAQIKVYWQSHAYIYKFLESIE